MTTRRLYNYTAHKNIPLVVDTSAYASGDVIGGRLSLPMVSYQTGGKLLAIHLVDDDDEKISVALHVFVDEPSTIADNAVYTPTIADLKKQIATIAIANGDYSTYNSNAIANKVVGIDFETASGTLWFYLVAGGAVTYSNANDLYLRITYLIE